LLFYLRPASAGAATAKAGSVALKRMRMEENRLLAPLTTFGVGGPARFFLEARIEAEIVEATAWAKERGLPVFILGGGSNLIVSDSGYDGLVLHVALKGLETQETAVPDEVLFRAAAGEEWDGFVQRTVEANCAGIECLAGIPGTVGGTPVQNVGAYGQEVASVIDRVRVFDLREHAFVEFSAAECEFAYRCSRFNSRDRGRYVVTRVDFRLRRNGAPALKYGELQKAFAAGAQPGLSEVADAVRKIRRGKGMLLVNGDADCRSAGSFFKNPVVRAEVARTISTAAGKEPPVFPAGDPAHAKIPAAWLIEQAGFFKGYQRGSAGISSRHTLALINRGSATAAEILALAQEIRARVEDKFGIELEMEPVLVGF
jgi:UDP-N-acetylmuramate dehydrogenase